MSYYKILGLEREPFSTSPDPHFFYRSLSHQTALKRLEINLRLKRGLSLILGDVGTGKTVLCRVLARLLHNEPDFILHLMLDPDFASQSEFLSRVVTMFEIKRLHPSLISQKDALERFLFKMGVERGKSIILVIDEGQKLSTENLELLRTFLNYETNEYKLLQLVILAQVELIPKISSLRNFLDRVSLTYTLLPLDEKETKEMVEFRLRQAGYVGRRALFSDEALKFIFQLTEGYPRRITLLCHSCLKHAVMKGKIFIDAPDIEEFSVTEKAALV